MARVEWKEDLKKVVVIPTHVKRGRMQDIHATEMYIQNTTDFSRKGMWKQKPLRANLAYVIQQVELDSEAYIHVDTKIGQVIGEERKIHEEPLEDTCTLLYRNSGIKTHLNPATKLAITNNKDAHTATLGLELTHKRDGNEVVQDITITYNWNT
jgi:hypothetical protein